MQGASCLVSPIPDHAFFEQPQFERLLGDNFLQVLRLAPELLDLISRRSPHRVTGAPARTVPPASRRLPAWQGVYFLEFGTEGGPPLSVSPLGDVLSIRHVIT